MPSSIGKTHQGGAMPPMGENELAWTEPKRLVIHPRLLGGVNLFLQALPILVWDAFQTRMSFHAATAIWDSLDLLLDGVEVDRGRNKVTVIRHMRGRRSRPLSDFENVQIDRIDDGHCSLSLAGPSDPFPLLMFRTYHDARHSAERIAAYLGCDIRDEALGPRILSRPQQTKKAPSTVWEEETAAESTATGVNDGFELLHPGPPDKADVLRIDHDETPRKSAIYAIALLLLSAACVVMAWFFRALFPAFTIFAAIGVAWAVLWILYRRRGAVFVRNADWCLAWRFFKTRRFTQRLPLGPYCEVVLHAENRLRENDEVNPYSERDEGKLSYAIFLDGETEPLEIRVASDLAAARRLATSVAAFTGLQFRDFTN